MNTFFDDLNEALASATSRRNFLKTIGLGTVGLVISIHVPGHSQGIISHADGSFFQPNAFLRIGSDGTISVTAKNPEIGQGIKTSLPQIIAEELEVDWKMITVEQGLLDQRLGQQGAGGSTGIKSNFDNLRKAGAAAREMLVEAAAKRWNVSTDACKASQGFVIKTSTGDKLSYASLAEDASKLKVPESPKLKSISEFTLIGKPIAGVDNEKIVTGRAEYGIDARPKDTVVAVIRRPAIYGASVKSWDDSEASRVNGVLQVVKIEPTKDPGQLVGGVAVIAKNTWAAIKASKLLKIEWETGSDKPESDQNLSLQFDANLNAAGEIIREDGNVEKAFEGAAKSVEATFEVPFLAHATLEPQNFIADVKADSVELIGPIQSPGLARFFAVQLTGVGRDKVKVRMTRSGGGFGRRLAADYACEAIYLSKAIGKPVQVVWTREDDITHDTFRPAGKYKLRAGLDSNNQLIAWHIKATSTARSMYALPVGNQPAPPPYQTEVFPDGFPAGFVPNFKMEYKPVGSRVPRGFWRAPGHNVTVWLDQSFIDDVAKVAGKDPVKFRLDLLGEENRQMPYRDHGGPTYQTNRLKNIINLAVQKSNWNSPKSKTYKGFACHFMFGSYVAMVITISQPTAGTIQIEEVMVVVDCGIVINTSSARNQIAGGVIDGLSACVGQAIQIELGTSKQKNFDSYKLLRMKDAPPVEIFFVLSQEAPEGLGEMSLPLVAPALCNAIFKATGTRVKKLPIADFKISSV
jgi:isoquinoline 1-oxidoreductase subunit beta